MYVCVYAYTGKRNLFILIKILQVLTYVHRPRNQEEKKKKADLITLGWVGPITRMIICLKLRHPNAA